MSTAPIPQTPLQQALQAAASVRAPLGTLGDLRIPYGVPHGSILAYAQEWVRRVV